MVSINRVMERSPNCSTLVSLLALAILVLLPVRSWCKEETYKSLTERKPECCHGEDAELKRFDEDVDYDSFVSLMGRRSAAQPNRFPFPCVGEYLRTKGRFINRGRQRIQRIL